MSCCSEVCPFLISILPNERTDAPKRCPCPEALIRSQTWNHQLVSKRQKRRCHTCVAVTPSKLSLIWTRISGDQDYQPTTSGRVSQGSLESRRRDLVLHVCSLRLRLKSDWSIYVVNTIFGLYQPV